MADGARHAGREDHRGIRADEDRLRAGGRGSLRGAHAGYGKRGCGDGVKTTGLASPPREERDQSVRRTREVVDMDEILARSEDPCAEICERLFGEVTPHGRKFVKNQLFLLAFGGASKQAILEAMGGPTDE